MPSPPSACRNGRVTGVIEHGPHENTPEKERPVRGDNRTGLKPYGRLGWMGARAEYSQRGGFFAPTCVGRRGRAARSKRPANFLTFREGFFGTKNYCAAGRLASITVDFSDAMVALGGFKARVGGISS